MVSVLQTVLRMIPVGMKQNHGNLNLWQEALLTETKYRIRRGGDDATGWARSTCQAIPFDQRVALLRTRVQVAREAGGCETLLLCFCE